MIVKMSDLKPSIDHIVMDEDGMFFAGMMLGEFVWTADIKEAKPIQTELQLNNLMLWTRKNLIWDSISSPRAKGTRARKKKKL